MPIQAHTSMPHSLGSPEGIISKKNVSQMEMFTLPEAAGSLLPRQIPGKTTASTLQEVSWCRDAWYTGGGGWGVDT